MVNDGINLLLHYKLDGARPVKGNRDDLPERVGVNPGRAERLIPHCDVFAEFWNAVELEKCQGHSESGPAVVCDKSRRVTCCRQQISMERVGSIQRPAVWCRGSGFCLQSRRTG